jgi:hypothetical protein
MWCGRERKRCPNTLSSDAILAENAKPASLLSEGKEAEDKEMQRCIKEERLQRERERAGRVGGEAGLLLRMYLRMMDQGRDQARACVAAQEGWWTRLSKHPDRWLPLDLSVWSELSYVGTLGHCGQRQHHFGLELRAEMERQQSLIKA